MAFYSWVGDLEVNIQKVFNPPAFEELTRVLEEAGIASVLWGKLPGGLRRTHFRFDHCHYSIRYSTDQWEGGKDHTFLHETYEIIHEMLSDPDPEPAKEVCRNADLFAASVLMQPAVFAPFAKASGFDIIALRSEFRCSYASVTLRLAEVMRRQPLLGVLYEREEPVEPSQWAKQPEPRQFKAEIVSRTPDFGVRDSRILCGSRGGMPRRGTALSASSLVEWVVLTGRAGYAEEGPSRLSARRRDIAIAATPIMWEGRLAKVAVVAVPYEHRRVLMPRINNGVAFEWLSHYQEFTV